MKLSDLLQRRSSLAAEIADLGARVSALNAELAAVDRELFGRLRGVIAAIEGAGDPGGSTATNRDLSLPPRYIPRRKLVSGNFLISDKDFASPESVGRVIRRPRPLESQIVAVLTELGRPANRNEIYDALVAKGVEVPGKDPRANLSAHLSYSPEVFRNSDGLWQLTKEVNSSN